MTKSDGHRRERVLALVSLLGEVEKIAVQELHSRLAEEGFDEIRSGHGCVFQFVDEQGSRLTELAERSGVTKQAVGEVASELEQLGYIERVADPGDRRSKIIRLTERGRQGQATATRILAEIEHRWAQHQGKDRITTLRETLQEIALSARGPNCAGQ